MFDRFLSVRSLRDRFAGQIFNTKAPHGEDDKASIGRYEGACLGFQTPTVQSGAATWLRGSNMQVIIGLTRPYKSPAAILMSIGIILSPPFFTFSAGNSFRNSRGLFLCGK
jgi:hypothetical protein